jgi:hypothetical protein
VYTSLDVWYDDTINERTTKGTIMLAYDRAILEAQARYDAETDEAKRSEIRWEIYNLELDKRDHYL